MSRAIVTRSELPKQYHTDVSLFMRHVLSDKKHMFHGKQIN
jgi:hypothetical protein